MCCGIYIVKVNGKLAKKRYYGSCYFFGITTKKHHLYSCASVDGSTLAQAYKCIFRPENG